MFNEEEKAKKLINNQRTQGKVQITPEMIRTSQTFECSCGGKLFSEKLMFKKLSSLITPSGKEEVQPFPVIVCEKCGKVPEFADPHNIVSDDLKDKKIDLSK
ncbi:MAG: hypothetical protein ACOC1K_02315 [Nanoarchaeota archaeon]